MKKIVIGFLLLIIVGTAVFGFYVVNKGNNDKKKIEKKVIDD